MNKKILYHAISMYHILCVATHKLLFNDNNKCVLILPDFIVEKWKDYMSLVRLGIFDEVYLFPYLTILHNRKTVLSAVKKYMYHFVYNIDAFDDIYVAGAHFYFSLFLLDNNIRFNFFEDAPGMYYDSMKMFDIVNTKYPVQAIIAENNGLFDASNKMIKSIYCSIGSGDDREKLFYIIDWLECLNKKKKNIILKCFNAPCSYIKKGEILIVFTQQFYKLGEMAEWQQKRMYEDIVNDLCEEYTVVIKKHPDDSINYCFKKDVDEINRIIPAELLPFFIKGVSAFSVSSSSMLNLKKAWNNVYNLEKYKSEGLNNYYDVCCIIKEKKGDMNYVEFVKKEALSR